MNTPDFGVAFKTNYQEYISQKTEQEAHFIQILYIGKFELKKLNLEKSIEKKFIQKLKVGLRNPERRLELIKFSKTLGII